LPIYEEILKDPFPVPQNGFIDLPTKPGPGLELDEAAVTKKPFQYRNVLGLGGLWEPIETFTKQNQCQNMPGRPISRSLCLLDSFGRRGWVRLQSFIAQSGF
jgi:hypothetical protein